MQDIEQHGLDILDKRKMNDWATFLIFELCAALNRLRTSQVK
jgi:hypothetical protein